MTFTDKAAGETERALAASASDGSGRGRSTRRRSRSCAARAEAPGGILSSKALLLRQIGNTLPGPTASARRATSPTEVEWAKNRRMTPERYLASSAGTSRRSRPT